MLHAITIKPQRHTLVSWQGCRVPLIQAGLRSQLALHTCVVSCESTRWLSWWCLGQLACLGNQLAEGWPRVVFAGIKGWLSFIPFVFHPPKPSPDISAQRWPGTRVKEQGIKPPLEITLHLLMLTGQSKPHGWTQCRGMGKQIPLSGWKAAKFTPEGKEREEDEELRLGSSPVVQQVKDLAMGMAKKRIGAINTSV